MDANNDELKFNTSYGEFYNRTLEREATARRDETILLQRGITKAEIDSYPILRKAFGEVQSDDTMKGLITVEVIKKDDHLAEAIIFIRDIQGIAEITFGEDSGELKTFGPFNLTELTVGDILNLIPVVVNRGTTYLNEMKSYGLTADALKELEDKKTQIEDQVKKISLAEGNRKLTTADRRKKANALYDLDKRICDVGFTYFRNRDAVKADDYLINDIPGNMQVRNGTVEKGTAISRELLGLGDDTQFELKVSAGKSLEFYFSRTEGGPVGPKSVTILYNPNNFSEVKASDLGL